MSKTLIIGSTSHLQDILRESTVVIADFYADWCGPCKAISPLFEQLSARLSRHRKITFVKIDTEKQREISQMYNVTALPTFIIFKNNQISTSMRGADPKKLLETVNEFVKGVDAGCSGASVESSGSSARWKGSELPRGYIDITDEVDIQGLDLLNADSDVGEARNLFAATTPSALLEKGGPGAEQNEPDWVESDTDEQLMLFVPFRATLKVHTLHLTSLANHGSVSEDQLTTRPRTIRIYSNKAHVLGFEEAEDVPATQEIILTSEDWDEKTGTAKIELRFVKFQNVTSLVLFMVDGDGQLDKIRVDRIRIIGEAGEKRELGKLEKVSAE